MTVPNGAIPRGARLGRAALACSAASFLLQPASVLIAVRGNNGDATAGEVVLVLSAASLLALAALVAGVVSLVRLRGALDKPRLPGLLAIVLGLMALISALGVGVFSLLMASNGGWIYMSQ